MTGNGAEGLRDSALRLLARRDHSRRELAGKLASRHALPAASPEIGAVLEDLQQGGYLSEDRFVESFLRERRQRGYGPLRIAQELRLRGVDEALIAECLNPQDETWVELALAVRRKRFGEASPVLLKDKARISRFLQYRGFLPEQVRAAL